MPKKKPSAPSDAKKKKPIKSYTHKGKKRANNPPVGLVTPETDPDEEKKTYAYDPHLDPQLTWAGKKEHLAFQVPTVSLHVHERIDPLTIIEAVKRRNGAQDQMSLFASPEENPPLREAIEFYKHRHNWSNRLIAGDSLLVMNSLIEKEGLAGQIQMVYLDPPYGIRYGSNFQPFVNKRDVTDGKDEDLSQEPETIKAFRDTWELGIHSYLTYLRDRLLLARELLTESGSCFVQIGDENLHLVRSLMDEVFGVGNFIANIAFAKTSGSTGDFMAGTTDYLLFYARNRERLKYHQPFVSKTIESEVGGPYSWVELADGTRRRLTSDERANPRLLPQDARLYRLDNLQSQSVGREKGEGAASWFPVEVDGKEWRPSMKARWKTNEEGMERLKRARRLQATSTGLYYVRFIDDFAAKPVSNLWTDTVIAGFASDKLYVVETSVKVIARCLLMSTDPGDLVFDPTCGSGATAYIAEQWGRRWITCDTSRVAVTLAKQRLMTAQFSYYELAHSDEGVGSGFRYRSIPHVMLSTIARSEPPTSETIYDQPYEDHTRHRVTGPFTVEAVPAPSVRSLGDIEETPASDESIARSGETARLTEWRDELLKSGVRARGGQKIEFTRIEPLAGTRWLHADGETKEAKPRRVVVSFGPEHAPLEQRQVALAIEEAQSLAPKPTLVLFCSFHFDPEAAKDIEETKWPGVTLVKVQMNTDLLTADLKKKRSSNESFWLVGQPDVSLARIAKGDDKGKFQVEVQGFDYYDPLSGTIVSGGADRIALWMLDPDYDGRSLFPRQVFFPMAGDNDGWARLAKNLRAEIDEERIEAYRGTISLPFDAGKYRRAAVKIVDDRGIESLKLIDLP